MGQRMCTAPILPTQPVVQVVLARPASTAIFNSQVIDITDYACMSADVLTHREIWIRDVLRAHGQ